MIWSGCDLEFTAVEGLSRLHNTSDLVHTCNARRPIDAFQEVDSTEYIVFHQVIFLPVPATITHLLRLPEVVALEAL